MTDAGITSGKKEARSHLIRFAEYCAMYLFAWSEVFWQVDGGKTLFPEFETATGKGRILHEGKALFGEYEHEKLLMEPYRRSVASVRQALANVPTYMIFDDHEVTDDWFLDRDWVNKSLSGLMQRIVQNGLAAYALFQAWGNTPSEFESGGKGALFLSALSTWLQAPVEANAQTLRGTVGAPTGFPAGQESFSRATTALSYHYMVTGPSYQVVVLDSRTRRGYPPGGHDHPGLLGSSALVEQFSGLQPPTPEQVVIVIAPCPVAGSVAIEAAAIRQGDPYFLDPEFWNARPFTFERLFARIAAITTATGGKKESRVVLLSGDVHYGFAVRVRYRATAALGEPAATTEAVFAQFTSSAFKNESPPGFVDLTRKLHSNAVLVEQVLQTYTSKKILDEVVRYGWNNSGGASITLGTQQMTVYTFIPHGMGLPAGIVVNPKVEKKGSPIIFEVPSGFTLGSPPATPAPDWRSRARFIASDDERGRLVTPPPTQQVQFPPPGDRNAALTAHLAALGNHTTFQKHAAGKNMVGLNNLGEISFQWGSGDQKTVTQELWWWLDQSTEPFPVTRYRCDMSLATTQEQF